jgi:hypothetical protein
MEFRIANTFTASPARLPVQDQKAAKTAVFDSQADPGATSRPAGQMTRDTVNKAYAALKAPGSV